MLRGGIWFLRKFYRPFTFLIASLTLVHLALKPEITLSEYFVTLRNLIWVVPLMFVCEYIWGSTLEHEAPKLHDSPRLYDLGE